MASTWRIFRRNTLLHPLEPCIRTSAVMANRNEEEALARKDFAFGDSRNDPSGRFCFPARVKYSTITISKLTRSNFLKCCTFENRREAPRVLRRIRHAIARFPRTADRRCQRLRVAPPCANTCASRATRWATTTRRPGRLRRASSADARAQVQVHEPTLSLANSSESPAGASHCHRHASWSRGWANHASASPRNAP